MIDLGKHLDFRSVEDSKCQADHLQILGSSRCTDISWLGSDIVDDGLLEPGNQKVSAFIDDLLFYSLETIEDNSSGSAFDIVDGGLEYTCCYC